MQKAYIIKENIYDFYCTKILNYYKQKKPQTVKNSNNKKETIKHWEKLFATQTNKELLFRTYNELLQIIKKR